jgi:UDP-N-acetylglucosamine acyltransferase
MTEVHPSAVVSPGAELAEGVTISAGAVIGPHVRLGARTWIGPYAILDGHTSLGEDCRVYPHAVLGTPPQDLKYHDEPTRLEIGARNLIREFVTIHRGTPQGRGVTRIGSDAFLMAYCHVAHDNELADHVIVANNAQLAGHVDLGAHAIVGGVSAIHQFVRVGAHAFIGGGSVVSMDVAPFCRASGNRARLHGLNHVGLRRRGFSEAELRAVRRAYRLVFYANLLVEEAARRIEAELIAACPALAEFVVFIRTSERGLTRA